MHEVHNRYTRSKDGDTLYAIVLGRREGDMTLTSVQVDGAADSATVQWLEHDEKLDHSVNKRKQLVIRLPRSKDGQVSSDHAAAYKLAGFTT
jgi:hypothetical protein